MSPYAPIDIDSIRELIDRDPEFKIVGERKTSSSYIFRVESGVNEAGVRRRFRPIGLVAEKHYRVYDSSYTRTPKRDIYEFEFLRPEFKR